MASRESGSSMVLALLISTRSSMIKSSQMGFAPPQFIEAQPQMSDARDRVFGQREGLTGEFLADCVGWRGQEANAFCRRISTLLRDLAFVGFADRVRQHRDRQAMITLAAR